MTRDDESTIVIPWTKPPSKRTRSILRPNSTELPLRPMKLERRATLVAAIARGRRWLDELIADQLGALVIAYEPVWAIGTGKNATAAEAGEAHAHIRSRLRQWFGGVAADRCRILYGGSVKPDNIRELIGLEDVDGALVGGASLEVRSFAEIVARAASPTS